MAAINESGLRRKRMATYGKAVRKRLPDNIASLERYRSLSQEKPGPSITSITPDVANFKTAFPPLSPSRSSADSDLLDVPSNDSVDSSNIMPNKRRKITRIYGENYMVNTTDQCRTLQQHFADEPIIITDSSTTTTQNVLPKGISSDSGRPTAPLKGGSNSRHSMQFLPPSHKIQRKVAKARNRGARQAEKAPEIGGAVVTADLSNAPRELEPSKFVHRLSTPDEPPVNEFELQGHPSTPAALTPRRARMWNGLLGEDCDHVLKTTEPDTSPSGNTYVNGNFGKAESNQLLPRRRLIDTLVEKPMNFKPQHSPPKLEEALKQTATILTSRGTPDHRRRLAAPASFEQPTERTEIESTGVSRGQISQILGPKITYNRQRSMLAEQDISESIAFDLPLHDSLHGGRRQNRRGSIPFLTSLQGLHERDRSDDGQAGVAIRTIHELRQAGAQSRFIDEVEDILDGIRNSSTRRSRLLGLAQKMKEKEFHDKFLANGMEHRLFLYLGQDRDVISGFLILSLVITLLDIGMTPVAIVQMRLQGIAQLLLRLLDIGDDIMDVAKDRKNNLSKFTQIAFSNEVQALLGLRVWKVLQVESVSPRTVALRCLELMVRQTRESGYTGAIISNELTGKVFSILKLHSRNGSWKLPTGQDLIDAQLALSTLESHSLNAMMSSDESTLVNHHLPLVRGILESTLKSYSDKFKELQLLVVRLTLNVTNNNPRASDVFATQEIMHVMGQALIKNFSLLARFMIEEERIKLVDHLILMLGVMMNFAECSVSARRCFHELKDSGQDPLDDLVRIFVENLEKTFEADSVEDSQRNVAFGWLAVVLGCLSLMPELESRIRLRQRTKTLRPLLTSIDEFISHHRKVDDLLENEVDGHGPQSGLTERLSRMVGRLRKYEGGG